MLAIMFFALLFGIALSRTDTDATRRLSEGIGLILGVDRFLDMCRTTLNVTGDLAAAVVVSRGESDPA